MGSEKDRAIHNHAALLVMDMQIDFCPGGSLAVAGGDTIIPLINRYVELFRQKDLPVYATRDWHPAETSHFSQFGGKWPAHCVQGTTGAGFHPALRLPDNVIIISKGTDPQRDDYSPLQVSNADGLTFADRLKKAGATHLYLCGMATDFCIRWSALDALHAGFKVTVLKDAVKGINLTPGDSERALEEISLAGGEMADLETIGKEAISTD
jgi:nicotinamidase/pyrazinamidase